MIAELPADKKHGRAPGRARGLCLIECHPFGGDLPILARILRDRGIVTERQLQEAIQHQVLYGGRLGTNLFELGFITEERLQEALGRAHGVTGAAVDVREIQPEAVALLPKAVAARYKVFPYKVRGKTLFLLMVDPTDHTAVAKVGYSLGYIVRPMVVPEFRMIQLLHDYYGVDERWRFNDTRELHSAGSQGAGRPRDRGFAHRLRRDPGRGHGSDAFDLAPVLQAGDLLHRA